MSTPRISVVLPTHNGQAFLGESIQSCLDQTFRDWELIIVDDASTDGTPGIISDFASRDDRIRVKRNAVNRRLPASLNIGFQLAQGQFLTWTSDDNRYRSTALEAMLSFLEQQPEISLVYSDYTMMDEDGDDVATVHVEDPESLALFNCVGACFLMRREVHEKLGGYAEELFLAEDYDFWLRASAEFRLAPLHESLYLYRYHRDSLSKKRSRQVREATIHALRRNLSRLHWMTPELKARAEAALADMEAGHEGFSWDWYNAGGCRNIVWCALREGKLRVARKYALTAMKLDPFSAATWRAAACALRGY